MKRKILAGLSFCIIASALVYFAHEAGAKIARDKERARAMREAKALAKTIMDQRKTILKKNAEIERLTEEGRRLREKLDEANRELSRRTGKRGAAVAESSRGTARGALREDILALIERECAKEGINPGPVFEIVMRESGGDPYAQNPASGASGLFQRVPGSLVVLGDAEGQVKDGIAYIKNRYSTSENAWEFWRRHHWY